MFQSFKVSKLQGGKVAKFQGFKVAKFQGSSGPRLEAFTLKP
jgi:hypothetical protein